MTPVSAFESTSSLVRNFTVRGIFVLSIALHSSLHAASPAVIPAAVTETRVILGSAQAPAITGTFPAVRYSKELTSESLEQLCTRISQSKMPRPAECVINRANTDRNQMKFDDFVDLWLGPEGKAYARSYSNKKPDPSEKDDKAVIRFYSRVDLGRTSLVATICSLESDPSLAIPIFWETSSAQDGAFLVPPAGKGDAAQLIGSLFLGSDVLLPNDVSTKGNDWFPVRLAVGPTWVQQSQAEIDFHPKDEFPALTKTFLGELAKDLKVDSDEQLESLWDAASVNDLRSLLQSLDGHHYLDSLKDGFHDGVPRVVFVLTGGDLEYIALLPPANDVAASATTTRVNPAATTNPINEHSLLLLRCRRFAGGLKLSSDRSIAGSNADTLIVDNSLLEPVPTSIAKQLAHEILIDRGSGRR